MTPSNATLRDVDATRNIKTRFEVRDFELGHINDWDHLGLETNTKGPFDEPRSWIQ